MSQAIDMLSNCKLFFENLRSDETFESIILEAIELSSEIDVEANFETTTPRHRVRSKTHQAINALETRYNLLNTHSNYFSFLYNIFGLKDMPRNELLAHCKDLEEVLTDGNSSDLYALELADEISIVLSLLTKKETPVEVLKFIATLKFAPNLSIALRILLTLQVTVASGERSFSKQKIIKNYLRTMLAQNRLNGLAMIAIERQISDKLDLKSLV
ncbi:uncharacterized protein, partial [Parasteatoda tepidariorum]|uniref:uncharacterized protein n=1 Tax=Parasteatoda tepidariorum TaxID=114398 RepID=UPI001C72830A